MKYLMALSVTFLLPIFLCAQITLKGRVLDSAGHSVAYSTVKLMTVQKDSVLLNAIADAKGQYIIEAIPAGSYRLHVTAIGYLLYKTDVLTLKRQEEAYQMDFQLQKTGKQLTAVTVTAQKPLIEKKADRIIVNVENNIAAAGNSVWDILGKAPGVEAGADNLQILGKSGVTIMVDDRPVYLSGQQVSTFLKGFPAGQIAKIEIITSPSARYDAQGGAGIINIVTRKSDKYGVTAEVVLSEGQGSYSKTDPSMGIFYNKKKISMSGSIAYNYDNDYLEVPSFVNYQAPSNVYFDQRQFSTFLTRNTAYGSTIDYTINTKNTIGFTLRGMANGKRERYSGETIVYGPTPDSTFNTASLRNYSTQLQLYNLYYKSKLDSSSSIMANLNYGHYHSVNDQDYNFHFNKADGSELRPAEYFFNSVPSDVVIRSGNIDYSRKFRGNLVFETGAKVNETKTSSSVRYNVLKNSIWEPNTTASDEFTYRERINAAYVSLNKAYKYITAQAGIRGEWMQGDGNSIRGAVVDNNYFQLFPSFSFQYSRRPAYQLNISYSTRVDRPNFSYLAPFAVQSDPYSFQTGNAFLRPSYTNTFELSLTFKKKYTVALSYDNIKDRIEQSVRQDNSTREIENIITNIRHCYYYRLYFILPFNITRWWNSSNTLNSYIIEYKTDILGGSYHKSKPVFYINSYNTFTFSKKWAAEMTVYYRTPSLNGLYEVGHRFFTDIGTRFTLVPDRAALKVSLTDVFFTNRWKWKINYLEQHSGFTTIRDSRVARLTFSYKFGNIKSARPSKRKTGSEEEQNRLN
jgi:iron complex outermembrane recepter protein